MVELTSGADGHILIDGLDAGVYYLKETKAPEGYVCSEEELTITIPDQADGSNLVSVKFATARSRTPAEWAPCCLLLAA